MELAMAVEFAATVAHCVDIVVMARSAMKKAVPSVVPESTAAALCSDSEACSIRRLAAAQDSDAAMMPLSSPANIAVSAFSGVAASIAATGGT
ncbi:hypothetical protein [Corynebacterium sp.]|uniref:hypothetical protein n=1 Tax=Corynebacterium sp. TaxID=1720 RepID=UPI0025C6CDA7|nr:hypothetical protein [Corynebacterium sp.]